MSNFEKQTDPLEADLQSDILDFAHVRAWWAIKVTSPSLNGVPDLYFLRKGRHVWIEVKRSPDMEADPQQQKRHREMRAQGSEVYVAGSMEEARRILR